MIASLIFITYRTKTTVRTSKSKTFKEFLSEIKNILFDDHNFMRYILSRILLTANYPAISLYAAYSHDKLQFHMSEAGIFTAITVFTAGLSSYAAGWIGDRFGHKRAMVIVFIFYFLALVTVLFARTLTQTYLVFVFLGMGHGGFWTTAMSLIYEFAGERDKKIYYALTDSITAPFVLIFIILTGIFIRPLGVPIVLMGIGIFILLGILSLIFLTKEPRAVRAGVLPTEPLF